MHAAGKNGGAPEKKNPNEELTTAAAIKNGWSRNHDRLTFAARLNKREIRFCRSSIVQTSPRRKKIQKKTDRV
jgi:hypothetical protein